MKRIFASLLLVTFITLAVFPNVVTAQTRYSINQIDHTIAILYSGNMVILDTIQVSGIIQDGFLIALPYVYSADVLKVLAYDSTHVYNVKVGVPLPDQSGFYGVSVDFNGATPSEFIVAFVLSNRLTTDQGNGNFLVEFPAYPSLTQTVKAVNVNVVCPTAPMGISIQKEDGNVTTTSYRKSDLTPYTYSIASANIHVPSGTLEPVTILELHRSITVDAKGAVKAADTYQLASNASSDLYSFMLSLPVDATDVAVKDSTDVTLQSSVMPSNDIQLVNATFSTPLAPKETIALTVYYNLPGAVLRGSQYMLPDFNLFTKYPYVVQYATITFILPEGATITSPDASELDSSATLTRNIYQDILTVRANDISYVDALAPQENTWLSYNYNPIWVSFGATFYASLAGVLFCVGAVVYRWKRPKQTYLTLPKPASLNTKRVETPVYETLKGTQVTPDMLREFTDAYEDKKQLTAQLHALDMKGLREKISRRQYKAHRAALESRIDRVTQIIERNKALFRGASGVYVDLIKQLDLAEADLAYAQETLNALELRLSMGEISLETYKKAVVEPQKTRRQAELAINGILLKLREKIR